MADSLLHYAILQSSLSFVSTFKLHIIKISHGFGDAISFLCLYSLALPSSFEIFSRYSEPATGRTLKYFASNLKRTMSLKSFVTIAALQIFDYSIFVEETCCHLISIELKCQLFLLSTFSMLCPYLSVNPGLVAIRRK